MANKVQWFAGILNGTTNFILSEMSEKNTNFDDALKQAQDLGLAEVALPWTLTVRMQPKRPVF